MPGIDTERKVLLIFWCRSDTSSLTNRNWSKIVWYWFFPSYRVGSVIVDYCCLVYTGNCYDLSGVERVSWQSRSGVSIWYKKLEDDKGLSIIQQLSGSRQGSFFVLLLCQKWNVIDVTGNNPKRFSCIGTFYRKAILVMEVLRELGNFFCLQLPRFGKVHLFFFWSFKMKSWNELTCQRARVKVLRMFLLRRI